MNDMRKYLIGILFFFLTFFLFYYSVIERQNDKVLYPYKMKLYFPAVDGLKEGTEVSVKGIPYGMVKVIKEVSVRQILEPRFITQSEKAIELTIQVKEPITLWDNYEVKFKSKTLFSGRMIDIDPGNYKMEESSFFKPTYLGENESSTIPSAKYYDEFFTSANNILVENRPDLRNTIMNLRSISQKMKSGNGTFARLNNTDEVYSTLGETIGDISIAAKEARRYFEMNRENETIPLTITMFTIFNLLNLNISSQGQN
jgi:ABC-type transporter Mla subunit MlaD